MRCTPFFSFFISLLCQFHPGFSFGDFPKINHKFLTDSLFLESSPFPPRTLLLPPKPSMLLFVMSPQKDKEKKEWRPGGIYHVYNRVPNTWRCILWSSLHLCLKTVPPWQPRPQDPLDLWPYLGVSLFNGSRGLAGSSSSGCGSAKWFPGLSPINWSSTKKPLFLL